MPSPRNPRGLPLALLAWWFLIFGDGATMPPPGAVVIQATRCEEHGCYPEWQTIRLDGPYPDESICLVARASEEAWQTSNCLSASRQSADVKPSPLPVYSDGTPIFFASPPPPSFPPK